MKTVANDDRIKAIRRDSLALIDTLIDYASAHGLASPPQGLTDLRRTLAKDAYTILVAGEANRGKSSLVNALIGRPVLPVDAGVATSQVFRVRHADQEGFRLRFEDDSLQTITAGDLVRFGSQAAQEPDRAIRLDQMIRWIEVDTPARFLPPNITLLDTPGLGSLHSGHAQVTLRFVPLADAVIFVLDSSQPVTGLELDSIDSILDVTPHILFVQTKIDQHRRTHWHTVRQRNEDILAARYSGRLADHRVWPIGSQTLLEGAGQNDEDFVVVSQQPRLAVAIDEFLFRVAGSGRIEDALTAATWYQQSVAPAFDGRLNALNERTQADLEALLAEAERRRQSFQESWGAKSPERVALAREMAQVSHAGIQQVSTALAADGPVARSLRSRIDALDDMESIRWMGEVIGRETVSQVMDAWTAAISEAQQRHVELLRPFAREAEAMSWVLAADIPQSPLVRGPRSLRQDWTEDLSPSTREEHPAAPLVQGAIDVLMLIGMVAPPVGLAASAASLAWSAARNIFASDAAQVRSAKTVLVDHLDDALDRIAQHYLVMPVHPGNVPLVVRSFTAMEEAIMDRVQEVASRAATDAEAEIARMTDAIGERRDIEAANTRRQAEAWHALGDDIARLLITVNELIATQSPEYRAGA